jgi:hypothetical protein
MSSIEIRKIGITKLDTDAVVNAANTGLWEGGGVCGYIFHDAGSKEMTAACQKIGHCDEGSAVITPGFKLPAKYVIHAVGPRWSGGEHNEPKLLYSVYKQSLLLAKENGLHSIGFPLISAEKSDLHRYHQSQEGACDGGEKKTLACLSGKGKMVTICTGISYEQETLADDPFKRERK